MNLCLFAVAVFCRLVFWSSCPQAEDWQGPWKDHQGQRGRRLQLRRRSRAAETGTSLCKEGRGGPNQQRTRTYIGLPHTPLVCWPTSVGRSAQSCGDGVTPASCILRDTVAQKKRHASRCIDAAGWYSTNGLSTFSGTIQQQGLRRRDGAHAEASTDPSVQTIP